MSVQYQIIIKDPNATTLAVAQTDFNLDYYRRINEVGVALIQLPISFDPYILIDGQIEIYRQVDSGPLYLEGETRWFVRKPTRKFEDNGQEYIEVYTEDANTLLQRRITAYYAGSSQVLKLAVAADDLIKTIVRDNMGSSAADYLGANTDRQLSTTLFAIQANLTQGAAVSKDFAWRPMLQVLQEIAQTSTQAGTYIAFDVVAIVAGTFELRTYLGQRGVDHRWPGGSNSVILDPQLGNLTNIVQADDYTQGISFMYCGGQGQDSDRIVQTATNSTIAGLSPYGRFEDFQDARQSTTAAGVLAEAKANLWAMRPKITFEAQLVQTPGAQYGVQYNFGDIVTARYRNRQFDCRIESVHVTKQGANAETVDAKIQSVS
jgi:hypothetical protein